MTLLHTAPRFIVCIRSPVSGLRSCLDRMSVYQESPLCPLSANNQNTFGSIFHHKRENLKLTMDVGRLTHLKFLCRKYKEINRSVYFQLASFRQDDLCNQILMNIKSDTSPLLAL